MGPKQQPNEEMAKKRKSFGIWQLAAALKPTSPNPQLRDELAKISADKWQTRRRHHGQSKSKTESCFEVRADNQNLRRK
ncbi:GM17890 [Drosophila sechellia]|uniref:GM17890 n=1 Tax=Drosophila sechellia TaxID=7238 RepID=B4I246_DROSE|nr:GM17890 [Drosophila sechellia]